MDPLNQNQNPISTGSQMPPVGMEPQQKSGVGPIAGAAIIIILLIAGGLYFWGAQLNETMNETPYIPSDADTTMMEDGTIEADTSVGLPPQSSSDDVSSIESDFNAMNLDAIDASNEAQLNNI